MGRMLTKSRQASAKLSEVAIVEASTGEGVGSARADSPNDRAMARERGASVLIHTSGASRANMCWAA